LFLSFGRNFAALAHRNDLQFRVVADAERMLAETDRYFDGVSMIPTRTITGLHPWWWWDVPTINELRLQLASSQVDVFRSFLNQQPKLWILNYRLLGMREALAPIWRSGTVRVKPNILISGREIPARMTVRFGNLWPGMYRLAGVNGAAANAHLIVDDRQCALPCAVAVGDRYVSTSSETTMYLVPADVRFSGPVPADEPVYDLFAEVYDF
jgi:hypothetical protein